MKKLLLFLAFFFAVSTQAQTNTARMLSGVNAQTGTSYTFVCTDATKLVTFNNGSGVSATLFAANDPCSGPGIMFSVKNIGAGTVTITPVSGTINGAASLVLQQLQGADIWNDGVNYTAQGSTSSGPAPPPGFPRLDQVTDQNTSKSFNQGTGTLAFTGGPGLDLSGETSSMSIPVVAGCTTTSNGQICFDPVGINIHGYNGTDSIVPLFSPSSVTSGDIAGFLLSGGKWTLQDLGPPSTIGGTPITAQITNIQEGDSLCWDSTATPSPTFVNCTPGVPPIVVSATSYTFDGTERGEILYFTAAGAKAISLPQASDTSDFNANWFTFIKNDGAGLATITATTSTFFSTSSNTLTIAQGIGCSIFSDPTAPGTYYDRCSPVPLTASTNITLTPAAYAISIAAAGGGGGTITGAGTANNVTKWTGAATVGNGCGLDDGSTAVRCDKGYDVNQLGAYLWWATNNAGTGTTLNKLACDDGTGKAIICPFASSTTNSPLGVAVAANGAAPGTTGSTGICIIGFCSVIMDNGATSGHYAQSSTTVNGDLSDVGATVPTNGQSYWYIYTGNAGAGTAAVIRNLTPSELNASSISGGNGRNLQVQVNGTATTKSIKNLNSSTPAPGGGFLATTVATSAAGNTDSIIEKIAISGNTSTVASAGTISGTANTCADGSGNITTSGCTAASAGGTLTLLNDTGTGTTLNKLVAQSATGKAILPTTSAVLQPQIGICTAGCGTTGDATVTFQSDSVACVFDGATTTNDLVIQSSTVSGDCHDAGVATWSTNATSSGTQMIVLSTNGGAGTYNVRITGTVTGSGLSKDSGGTGQLAMWGSAGTGGISPVTGLVGSSLWQTTSGTANSLLATGVRDTSPDFFCSSCALLAKPAGSSDILGLKFTSAAGGIGGQWALKLEDSTNVIEGGFGPNSEVIFRDFNTGFCGMGSTAFGFSSVGTYSRLQKINSTTATTDLATTALGGAIGVADQGCFTIVYSPFGRARIDTDNAETVGDYLIPSTSTGGKAHSVGAVWPFTGQIIGQAYATNGGSASATKYMQQGAEVRGGAFGLYNNDQLAQVALVADTTMFTVGGTTSDYRFSGGVACDNSSAAATATLNLKYTDTGNTAQTVSVTATCTTLGAASVAQITQSFRAKNATNITYGVTIANTPTYDVFARLEALGPN